MNVLVLGAGQLARMMSLSSAPLNIKVTAFDVGSENIVHPLTQQVLGSGLADAIQSADVITAEFEHIPHDVLDQCEASGKFYPHTDAIKAGGDRRIEKALLDNAGVKNAKYAIISNREDFDKAIETVGIPMVLKTALGGYDGKGQWRLKSGTKVDEVWAEMSASLEENPQQAIVAEEFVPFSREVSLVGARNQQGDIQVYPLAENVHVDGVLSLSTAIDEPALQNQAKEMFTAVAKSLNYVGVLALEFFDVGGQLLVNEIAPRVHNSGHWTQQGAQVCQFENHIRAVLGLPLGSTALLRDTAMVNILGQDSVPDELLSLSGVYLHWYGKEKRAGRKMGHINVTATPERSLKQQLHKVASILGDNHYPALSDYL